MAGVALCFALATLSSATEKGFMWDGTQWKALGYDLKVAYVKGVGNMADFEAQSGAGGQAGCISKALVAELPGASYPLTRTSEDRSAGPRLSRSGA